ncbi:MAG: hypothetical protein JXA54_06025 [Candidatus Heimdallarchaeota archaeon]|nr:hypothetical protein [Candidatus Heimdallarchaeota archaeon]
MCFVNSELIEGKKTVILFDKTIELRNIYIPDTVKLELKNDGEKITASKIDGNMDVLQIITEKLEQNTWEEGLLFLRTKLNPYPYHLQFAYIHTLEKLVGNSLIVPERANYLRTILLEFERIASHVSILAKMLQVISYPFIYAQIIHLKLQVEKILYDYFSPKDKGKSSILIGGLDVYLTQKMVAKLQKTIIILKEQAEKIHHKIAKNIVFKGLFKEVGFLSRELALKYSLVGPIARSVGITDDVRKTDPYAAYKEVYFSIPVSDSCDLYGETMVIFDEINESISIISQLLDNLPNGSLYQNISNLEIPAKNVITRIETPMGEMFCFAISKSGSLASSPRLFRITSPQKINIQGFLTRLSGEIIENLPLISSIIGEGWYVA